MPKKNQRRSIPAADKKPVTKSGKSPLGVIGEFCDNYHLPEAQDMLWEWLVTALGKSPSQYDQGKERSNLFFFYENIDGLLEAIYILNAQRTPGKPTPPKTSQAAE
ncbi:hypothetical protein [Paraflavitalea pollutisoli]|uniref:hypothetical protein n=1 Tax=Paraflavitalea pollutisoli TaxID=3034143 RepID=UPI0023EA9F69|nr:hypothetical protein [Paraflavitalea sp. H1-2-19X]